MRHTLIFFFAGLMLLAVSCTKKTVCQNGGTIDYQTGNCQCATGYSGVECEFEMREVYYGTFTGDFGSLDGNGLDNPYTAVLEKNTDDVTRVNITLDKPPFNGMLIGIVNENGLHIPLQTLNGKTITGGIDNNGNSMNINVEFDGSNYTASLTH